MALGRFSLWHLAGFRCGTWQTMADTDIGISQPFYTLFWPSLDSFLWLEFSRKIRRRAYELYMSGAFGGSLRVSRQEARGGGCRFGAGRIFRTRAGNCAILPIRQFNSFAFVALLARVKPGKFQRGAAIWWMRPFWAHLLS